MPRTINNLVRAADLPRDSPAEKYHKLLRLTQVNGDDVQAVHDFFCRFEKPQRIRYVQWFRADELLSHYRTLKDRSTQHDEFWIRIMQSRANADQLKIWLLGADRLQLSACFDSLLGAKGINIQEQYGTVATEDKVSVLSTHVEKSIVLRLFGTRKHDLRGAMENLARYLQEGLRGFFSSNGCTGSACITAFAASAVATRRWLNGDFFVRGRHRGGPHPPAASWVQALDIQELNDNPPGQRLRETWLLCLLFCFPRVISHIDSFASIPQGSGRMPNSLANDGKRSRESAEPDLEPSFFKALGDPTRLTLFRLILRSNGPLSVSELQRRTGAKITTVSECLQELKAARLVDCQRAGKFRLYFACVERFRSQLEATLGQMRPPRAPKKAKT
jgi:DNA-binding transcriptional ArsR family regulator